MIKVPYVQGCRMGNHLFQYVAGRLLAHRLGMELHAEPIPGIRGTYEVVAGKRVDGWPVVLQGADPLPSWHEEWSEVSHLRNKAMEVRMGFVHWRYFVGDRDLIRKWLAVKPLLEPHPDDLLVNVRLGDFIAGKMTVDGLVLAPLYYTFLLERLRWRKLYLMTDEPGHPYLDCLSRFGPEIIAGHGAGHFAKAVGFKRMILPNSTFSWWFAFVSEATEIYLPMPNGSRCGSWSFGQLPSIDLRVDLPEYTTAYNIDMWERPIGGLTVAERDAARKFAKRSGALFLP